MCGGLCATALHYWRGHKQGKPSCEQPSWKRQQARTIQALDLAQPKPRGNGKTHRSTKRAMNGHVGKQLIATTPGLAMRKVARTRLPLCAASRRSATKHGLVQPRTPPRHPRRALHPLDEEGARYHHRPRHKSGAQDSPLIWKPGQGADGRPHIPASKICRATQAKEGEHTSPVTPEKLARNALQQGRLQSRHQTCMGFAH